MNRQPANSLKHNSYPQHPKKQRGFGLVEILFSTLIFVIGIVGVVRMQTEAVRMTLDSMQRSYAVWMSNELSERIKVNFDGLDSGRYQATATAARTNMTAYCAGTSPTSCIGATCSSNALADYDIYDVMCVNTHLLNPELTITCLPATCTAGAQINILISWDSSWNAGTQQQLTLVMRR